VNDLVDPFVENVFMLRSLGIGVLVSLCCAIVGTYVVLRGLAFIGDALAHGVLPGVAIAVILGLPAVAGAAVGAAVMIGGVGLVTRRSRLSGDSAIGLLFVGLLALGVLIVSAADSLTGDLEAILFGEFLGTSIGDIWFQAVTTFVVAAVAAWSARPFLLLCLDPDQAAAMGYRVAVHHRVMLVLVAATIVASFQTVGALLVFGMLLAPAGTGALVTRRVGSMMVVAAVVGVLSTYLGLLASYHFGWAASAAVVMMAVGIFFAVLIANGIAERVRR